MIGFKSFLSGFLATLVFHQGLFTLLWLGNLVPRAPYDLSPVPPLGVPAVVSLAFFGGLWGIILWAILGRLAGLRFWLGHLIVGAVGPTAVAMWVVFPAKDIEVSARTWIGGLILNGVWGIGVGVFMRLIKETPPAAESA